MKELILGFHRWMLKHDTADNAEQYFHYSDEDMLEEYLKEKEVRKFKLDDSFKKALEEAVVSDMPASSWMDEHREAYDKLLKSGMFFEFHPTWTGEWDKDKFAFCHGIKFKKK